MMQMNRRQLIIIAAAVCAGCDRSEEQGHVHPTTSKPAAATTQADAIDAGPIAGFPPNAVSDAFRDQGFFIIHRDKQVFALSAICTHKGCKVRLADDQSFYCKCHGSTFDPNGKVTKGPAVRDLPRLSVAQDRGGHLLVRK
jgi:Rieske Fe-S protein